jgi:hypothetical protein
MSKQEYKGQCLCGEIKYQVSKIEQRMAHCHCTMCRKFHGAAFSTYGEAKVENFKWLQGKDFLKSYLATNGTERLFCKHCGSSLIFKPANDTGQVIEFSLATLDSNMEQRPDAHVFTDNRASWFEITDSLPQFKAGRK